MGTSKYSYEFKRDAVASLCWLARLDCGSPQL